MARRHIDAIDHTVQTTYQWIGELDTVMGWESRQRSYRLLRAVLHALRDLLPVNEAADLGAQLPMLLRGLYYEGWRPATTPAAERSRADLVAAIDAAFETDPLSDTEQAISAVFSLLSTKVSAGEVADVRHVLPREVRALWPG